MTWEEAFARSPLIAILRGLVPARALEVAGILFDAGFRIVEVPLNSPHPFESIEMIAREFGDRMMVGAGTVLTVEDVDKTISAGGRLIVAPNLDLSVGARVVERNGVWCPGVMTPTEAFSALRHCAAALKFFPAEMLPPHALSAMRAVLPPLAKVIVVGGITPARLADYSEAGAHGFGLGSALFKPEYDACLIAERASAFRSALSQLRTERSCN